MAARLGLARRRPTRYLEQTADIDLGNNMGNAAGGVHAAALGSLWQAVVLGVGGVRPAPDDAEALVHRAAPPAGLAPPRRSRSRCRGRELEVHVEPAALEIAIEGDAPLPLRACGRAARRPEVARRARPALRRAPRPATDFAGVGGDSIVMTMPATSPPSARLEDARASGGASARSACWSRSRAARRAARPRSRLGRLIAARAAARRSTALFVWPTPISPSEVPRLLGLPPEALEGVVLDVEVGDPAERIVGLAARAPGAFVVLAAERRTRRDACGLGEIAARAAGDGDGRRDRRAPGRACSTRLARILVPLDGTPSTAARDRPAGELARRRARRSTSCSSGRRDAGHACEPGAMAPPQYVDQPQHEWPAFSEEFVQRFLGAHRPLSRRGDRALLPRRAATRRTRSSASHRSSRPDLLALVWHGDASGAPRGGLPARRCASVRCPVLVLVLIAGAVTTTSCAGSGGVSCRSHART